MSVGKVFGEDAKKLKNKTVLIVGAGGLGCNVASLLARMQINIITLDDDFVSTSNLERQPLYDKRDILKYKVDIAKEKLSQFTHITAVRQRLNKNNIRKIFGMGNIDLVIDSTDNVETRLLLNDFCRQNKLNWIYSAAVKDIGAIYFINNSVPGNPCYQCINKEKYGQSTCDVGILNTAAAVVASFAANIALNYLCHAIIPRELIRIHMRDNSLTKYKIKVNPECFACKGEYNYLQ